MKNNFAKEVEISWEYPETEPDVESQAYKTEEKTHTKLEGPYGDQIKSLCLSGPVKQNIFLLLGINISKMQTQFTLRETQLSLSKVAKAHLL